MSGEQRAKWVVAHEASTENKMRITGDWRTGVCQVAWEPGDATRYELYLFTPPPSEYRIFDGDTVIVATEAPTVGLARFRAPELGTTLPALAWTFTAEKLCTTLTRNIRLPEYWTPQVWTIMIGEALGRLWFVEDEWLEDHCGLL